MHELPRTFRTAQILLASLATLSLAPVSGQAQEKPNVVIILADDLGYGDLGCYGHPSIATPNLDRMATEGQKWTSFYAAASVCTPSRFGLLTGRLPVRAGMCDDERRVLFPDSSGGIPASEFTLAEALGQVGYATGMVGKWHLGHLPEYLPTRNGFDHYFGLPYSNDMDRVADAPPAREAVRNPRIEYFHVPLMRNEEIIERPADQRTLTRRYTDEAVQFIQANADGPFFLYMAHSMPHVPLFRSESFEGKSRRGLYGDVVEELDASVGRILDTIQQLGLKERTHVFFTSDNGPWLVYEDQGGSAGLLRDGKGCTWEGGMRVPFLAWGGIVGAGQTVAELGSTLDLFPTSLALAGFSPPGDRFLDGYDLRSALTGQGRSPRRSMFYYRGKELYAVRHGAFKAHFMTENAYGQNREKTPHDPPLLFQVEHDPGERRDVAAEHPEVIAEIRTIATEHKATVKPVPDQMRGRISKTETQ